MLVEKHESSDQLCIISERPPPAAVIRIGPRASSAPTPRAASTVPRYCPRFLMIETRQLLSLAAVGFFLALFIGEVGRNMAE